MTTWTPWSKAELTQLEAMVGNMPADLVAGCYNRWATINDYPFRSKLAVQSVVYRNRMSMEATGRWVKLGFIATSLGISIDVPQKWVTNGLLKSRFQSPGKRPQRYVRRDDLLAFARKHPERLGGIPAERLALLLEDEDLARSIAVSYPRRPCCGKQVRCVETGKLFPTTRAAAKAAWVSRQAISYAMKSGGTAGGFHWEEMAA